MKLKPGEVKIFHALTNHLEGLTFSELKKETGLSQTALSSYLNDLLETGTIRKDYRAKKYLLASIYLPMKDFANEWQRTLKKHAVNTLHLGRQIHDLKDRDKRAVAMEKFLKFSFHSLTLFIWKIIGEALNEYDQEFKSFKDVSDLNPRTQQELALRRSEIIKEAIENWIVAIADSLAIAILFNIDLMDVDEQVYKEVFEQANQKYEELKKIIFEVGINNDKP